MSEFSRDELEIFTVARTAGVGLRKTFDAWVDIEKALQVARQHADADGGSRNIKAARLREILKAQDLGWLGDTSRKAESSYLSQVTARLPDVQKWRAGLTDYERTRWSSPQSIFNRCEIFHPNGKTKGRGISAKPLSVSALLKMPGAEMAQLLYDRNPSKSWALRRALDELLDGGTAPKPRPGWAAARERESAAMAS
jgi:hypothetical protein